MCKRCNEEEDLDIKKNFNDKFSIQVKLYHLIENMDNLDQIPDTLNFEGSNELVQFKRGNTQYHGDGTIKYKSFHCSKRAPKKKKTALSDAEKWK